MTKSGAEWLEPFDKALLYLLAIDHDDAGVDEYLLSCYADLERRDAALAFGSDYERRIFRDLYRSQRLARHAAEHWIWHGFRWPAFSGAASAAWALS